MKKISIIVPMYNSEKYISRCLDSILHQTFSDFEIILVDDGSTDSTAQICHSYVDKHTRISYFYQENAGPDYARKKGIEEATGAFLVFVDADDYIESTMLEVLYKEMEKSGADLVCCQMAREDSAGKRTAITDMKEACIDCNSVEDNLHHYFATRYINSSYGTKLIRKELLKDYEYLKESVIGEDVAIILYLLQQADKVRIINCGLYQYYWNGNSISHSGYSKRHYISLINYIKVKKGLLEKNIAKETEVHGFFAEYEMAVATAMSRNWMIDKAAMNLLRKDLKECMCSILKNSYTPFYMKVCVVMYTYLPYLFMGIYRGIYKITGR